MKCENPPAFSQEPEKGSRRYLPQQRLDRWQPPGDDDFDAGPVRILAVLLVQCGIVGDAVEKKGIERDSVTRGEPRVDGVELVLIIRAEIGRSAHAQQQDRQM